MSALADPVSGESQIQNPKSKMEPPLLRVEDLRVELPVGGALFPAVDGVSFEVFPGESLAIVGESGSGKTQLARALLGLSPDGSRTSGRILFGGAPGEGGGTGVRDVLALSERERRALRGGEIGLVFQEPGAAFDPVRTVGRQIVEAIRLHRDVSVSEARSIARDALRDVAFPDPEGALEEYAHRLSGGMRQRAFLAMTLAPGPRLLLADEPTASLDATVAAQVLEEIDELRARRGLSVVIITHDLGIVAEHCSRVLVLYAGRVVEEADTRTLFEFPRHPYTRGLLRSIPRLGAGSARAGDRHYAAIPGALPDLAARPTSRCAFAPRCSERFDRCDRSEPPLYGDAAGTVRCFLFAPDSAGRSR
jgi:oligopeptide/dipeptide ABC transporter ATP-binding protein